MDDHPVLRRGLAAILESEAGLTVCGEASSGREAVVAAARAVLQGGVYLSPAMSEKILIRMTASDTSGQSSPVDSFSDRELQVFALIGEGLGPSDIAQRLHLSVKTVETYRANLREKLDLPDAGALRQFAVKWMHERSSS